MKTFGVPLSLNPGSMEDIGPRLRGLILVLIDANPYWRQCPVAVSVSREELDQLNSRDLLEVPEDKEVLPRDRLFGFPVVCIDG